MEPITKKYDATESKTVVKSKQIFKTSDGREFDLNEKSSADKWQKRLDAIEILKNKLCFKEIAEIPVPSAFSMRGYNADIFTFDWNAYEKLDVKECMNLLGINGQQEHIDMLNKTSGRFIYIENVEENYNGRDSIDSKLILVSEFIDALEKSVISAKEILSI